MKREFLAVYDYGMGGIWVIMRASTDQEITAKYPELSIMNKWPAWMTEAEYAQISQTMLFDIDDPPTGWLQTLVQTR